MVLRDGGGGFRPRALLLCVLLLVIVDAAGLKAHAQMDYQQSLQRIVVPQININPRLGGNPISPRIGRSSPCGGGAGEDIVVVRDGRRRLLHDSSCGPPPPHPPPHPPPAYRGRKLQGFNAKRTRNAKHNHHHQQHSREVERDRLLSSFYY